MVCGVTTMSSRLPAASSRRSSIATVGFVSPRSIRVTVDGETPDAVARSRADMPACSRAVRTRTPVLTILGASTQRRKSTHLSQL